MEKKFLLGLILLATLFFASFSFALFDKTYLIINDSNGSFSDSNFFVLLNAQDLNNSLAYSKFPDTNCALSGSCGLLAYKALNETITGSWDFNGLPTVGGGISNNGASFTRDVDGNLALWIPRIYVYEISSSRVSNIDVNGDLKGFPANTFSLLNWKNGTFSGDVNAGRFNASQSYDFNNVKIAYGNTGINNYFFGGAGNTTMTGTGNTAVGKNALIANTTGANNTAIGFDVMRYTTTATNNTVVGEGSLDQANGSSNNAVLGNEAMRQTTGAALNNVAVGTYAIYYPTNATGNTAVGASALFGGAGTTTMNYNTAIGAGAGQLTRTGIALNTASNSIYIGANARADSNADVNAIVIGTNAQGMGANTTVLGTPATTKVYIYGSIIAQADQNMNGKNILADANLQIITGGGIYPSADSTTAVYINKADNATHIMTVDSTNGRIGIGGTPTKTLHVFGTAKVSTAVNVGDAFTYTELTGDLVAGNANSNSRFLFGQSTTVFGGMTWNYNATPASAYLTISAGFEGASTITNQLTLSRNGNVGIGTGVTTNALLTLLGGAKIAPSADSTTALNIANAAGTSFVTFDTTGNNMTISGNNSLLNLSQGGDVNADQATLQGINMKDSGGNSRAGIDYNMNVVKSVDLVGLTKVMCDMNYIKGILVASTC